MQAIQDTYPDDLSHCYGCGKNNADGHQIKSYWRDGVAVARFIPSPHHTAVPGFVYGGLIASLVDCHATGTASAAFQDAQRGHAEDQTAVPRFVTASLHVDYLAPTPMGPELVLTGRAVEIGARKVIVDVTVTVGETVCARGKVVAVVMPQAMGRGSA